VYQVCEAIKCVLWVWRIAEKKYLAVHEMVGTCRHVVLTAVIVVVAAAAAASPECHLMPTMIISGGGTNSMTPASYFVHDSFTLQITIVQVRLPASSFATSSCTMGQKLK